MFKKIDHILAALGNMKAMKRTHVDTYTEERMRQITGEQIAGNHEFGIWVYLTELAGYQFLELTMLSNAEIKTFKGITLSFLGGELEMYVDSDTKEITSDYSNVSNRWMTQASFEVSDEDIEFIRKKEYKTLSIIHKKRTFNFRVIT